MLRTTDTFDDELMGFFPVLARACNVDAPRYATVDPAFVSSTPAGVLGRSANKVIAPGFFAGSIPNIVDKVRPLPRTTTVAASAASATALTVKNNTAVIFVPGDVLSILAPNARANIQSASTGWAAADTVTITIGGTAVVYAVVAEDIGGSLAATNQLVADKVLAAVKANAFLSNKVDGKTVAAASGSVDILFWAQDFASLYSLAAADTATNGTASAVTSVFAPNTVIGTVAASGVNVVTNVLTISAASVSVPNGTPIGIANSSPVNLGMLSPNQPMDLLWRASQHYALYTDACVYRNRLPYWDGQLASLFAKITLV